MPESIVCRGVRGAITIDENSSAAILDATRELLTEITAANDMQPEEIASAIFTTTSDITAAFPAEAARQLGWTYVPLLCTREMEVPTGLESCIRVLLHWNTTVTAQQVQHVYLREARKLRPDLAG